MITNNADDKLQYLNRILVGSKRKDNDFIRLFVCWAITLIISIILGVIEIK